MVDHAPQPKAPPAPRQAATSQSPAAPAAGGERVAKALARAGVASRREVERYIAEGRVSLNGRTLDTPAVKIEPGDVLKVDGQPVAAAEPTRVWRYHKPMGLVTSNKDPQGRPTVFDALPKGLPRVISVGRLDLNSEGLLLLTNDGGLARALELPANALVRQYRARAYGRATQEMLDRLKDGITVEGVEYGPIQARLDKVQRKDGYTEGSSANCWISVSLKEGRNREVRRVLEALGLKVNRLVRLAYGPFALTTLPLGALEEVGPRVIREQLAQFIAPEELPTGARAATPLTLAPTRRAPSPVPVGDGGVKPPKKVYKPGWAKPAKTLNRPPAKPSAKRQAADKVAKRKSEGPAADAVVHARPNVTKPGVAPRAPRSSGARAPGARSMDAKSPGKGAGAQKAGQGRSPRTPRPAR
jgi:23S rRNA pseudouridine2605 synthase